MIKNLLLVGLGGGIGSMLRWSVGLITSRSPSAFPLATFVVNIIGAILIGLVYGYLEKNGNNDAVKLILITGFCGGFTTFSAFSFENFQLIQSGLWHIATAYILLSTVLCIIGVFIGFQVTS